MKPRMTEHGKAAYIHCSEELILWKCLFNQKQSTNSMQPQQKIPGLFFKEIEKMLKFILYTLYGGKNIWRNKTARITKAILNKRNCWRHHHLSQVIRQSHCNAAEQTHRTIEHGTQTRVQATSTPWSLVKMPTSIHWGKDSLFRRWRWGTHIED